MTTREESIVWESCLLHKAAQLRNTVLTVKLPPQNFENGNEMIVGKPWADPPWEDLAFSQMQAVVVW